MTLEQIKISLRNKFPDARLEVSDVTGTQNHYQVEIQTKAFSGLTRIGQHKMIMAIFDKELRSGELHALALKTSLPEKD